jgi:hypothetical protein
MRLWEVKFNTSLHGDYDEWLVELVPENWLSLWLQTNEHIDEITIKCLGQIDSSYITTLERKTDV